MATAAREQAGTRSERVVILMSAEEKRWVTARAETMGMSVSDDMQEAADDFTPLSEAERAELQTMLAQLQAGVVRAHSSLDRLEARENQKAPDHAACRARLVDEFRGRQDIDWPRLAALFGGGAR